MIKYNLNYTGLQKHKFDFGLESILYDLTPGTFVPDQNNKVSEAKTLPQDRRIENGIYISDQINLSDNNKRKEGLLDGIIT